VCEIATPINIFGLTIADGELVHADRHGALVIPADYLSEIGAAIDKLIDTEQIVLAAARRPDFDFDRFATAWKQFEESRT
jgi:regulator of RNase E activity RraA